MLKRGDWYSHLDRGGEEEKEGNKNRSNEQIFKKVLPDMKLVQYMSPVHLG